MNPSIKIENHFVTPIVVACFEGLELLNNSLTKIFLDFETKPEKYRNNYQFNTNVGELFDSHFDLFKINSTSIIQIKKIIEDSLRGWIGRSTNIEPSDVLQLKFESDSWFHITRKGGQKTLHNHPNASWSVVYYVDGGDVDLENRSGVIQFYDPRSCAGMYRDNANMQLKREYNFDGVGYLPQAGMLLIFPSYLYHEVLPYRGERPRINIAANFWIK